jgi:hypothetical protein
VLSFDFCSYLNITNLNYFKKWNSVCIIIDYLEKAFLRGEKQVIFDLYCNINYTNLNVFKKWNSVCIIIVCLEKAIASTGPAEKSSKHERYHSSTSIP